jgi:long-chain acyl-CoA synthetase
MNNSRMEPSARTPLEYFLHWESKKPGDVFLRQPVAGRWHVYTFHQAGVEARRIAGFLKKLSFPPGSRIAILSKNCAHWFMADLAIMMSGHVSVPIFPTLSGSAIKHILDHSEATAIFIGKLDDYSNQREGIRPGIEKICFDLYGLMDGQTWTELTQSDEVLADVPAIDPSQTATIMYSSGTTGDPKGVMLSHGALGFVGMNFPRHLSLVKHQRFFSYLPLSHIAERALLEMVALYTGSTISFAESLDTFTENLQHEQPTVFGGVPRIWTKLQDGILSKMGQKKLNFILALPLINGVVKRKIRAKLGLSKTRVFISGAASIPPALLRWYAKLGITIREVYGMTENAAYATACYDEIMFGSVGKPLPEVEIKIAEAGEILIKHSALMQGYYKDPEVTGKVFTSDGFLRTGDEGQVDERGFVYLSGRIRDQFKTDKGKFIVPAPIEMKLLSSNDIEQVCVVGSGIPQPIALTILSEKGRAKSHDKIIASLIRMMDEANQSLEKFEKLACAVVLKEEWTIQNGLITPSLKVKRIEVEKMYSAHYFRWFNSGKRVILE